MKRLLAHIDVVIQPTPERIYFCYSEWQPSYNDISHPELEFHQGVKLVDDMDESKSKLVIYDDLMESMSDEIASVFTRKSHHRNLSAFFITQNLYQKAKQARVVSLNSHYLCIFRQPRDKAQIMHLGRSMYPNRSKFLVEAYTDATSIPYGYLLIDLRQDTDDDMRLRTNIFPDETTVVYVKK